MTRDPNAPKFGLEWYTKGCLASGVLLAALLGAFLLRGAFAGAQDTAATGTPLPTTGPTAAMVAGDMILTMRITDGPYFVGELIEADLTLSNSTTTTYEIFGASQESFCGDAVVLSLTGGHAPHFQMPNIGVPLNCPLFRSDLAPNQTWRFTTYFPLTASGELTLTASVRFRAALANPTAQPTSIGSSGPFTGGWPYVRILAASRVPADRAIRVRMNGPHATISVPSAAQPQLRYFYGITCLSDDGPLGTGNFQWDPLGPPYVDMPSCGGSNQVWSFAVGAPGYGIGTGQYSSGN